MPKASLLAGSGRERGGESGPNPASLDLQCAVARRAYAADVEVRRGNVAQINPLSS